MTEQTVEVGDTRVTIRETEDGFEAVEASPEPGTAEQFTEAVGCDDGDTIAVGNIASIEQHGRNRIRIHVSDESYDVVNRLANEARDEGWYIDRVEFEMGQVDFVYIEE